MKITLVCLFIILISACQNKEQAKVNTAYFNIEAYFKQEATRLTKNNKPVIKTVIVNKNAERKQILISNWQQEFSSFIDADINKASWQGAFKLNKTDSLTTYESNNEKIPVKKVMLTLFNDKVMGVTIIMANKNVLYTSNDTLSYYPDSLYEIKKNQKIKLMDGKRYIVSGKFN